MSWLSHDKCFKDPVRSIYGTVELKSDPYCTGVIVPATIPKLTIGSVLYLIAGKKDIAINWMGPLKHMGIKRATLELEAGKLGVKLSARGTPMVATDDSSAFTAFIQKFLDYIVFEISAGFKTQGGFTFEARAGSSPLSFANGNFQLSNAKQTIGPSVFLRHNMLPGGGSSSDVGMTLPLLICVENCGKATERFLAFTGELYMSLEVAAGVPPSTLLNGDLKMDGWWYNMLGIPFAHLGNVWVGIGFDMKVGIFPPTRLEIGGQMCFGKKESCVRLGPNDNFIKGAAYVGISASQPADNYFMAMVTETTLRKIFYILGDTVNSKFYDWAGAIPEQIMNSGLEPFHREKCEAAKRAVAKKEVSSTVSKQSQLDMNCFAYVSVSPAASKELEFQTGTVFIDQGIGLSGRINIMGYRVGLEAQISKTRFYVNVEMDHIDLGFLKIGKEMKNGKVVGNPKFLIDFNLSPPSALINIRGAFNIPILQSSGEVTVALNKQGFKFEAGMSILGGIIKTHVLVQWDWKMKKFEARIKPTNILGLVKICAASDFDACKKDAIAIFKTTPKVSFEMDAGINIPALLTRGNALIEAKDGKFYMNLYAKLFGVFENEMTVISDKSMFELKLQKRIDLKQAIVDVGEMAKEGIETGFEAMLKVTENIKKVENAVHWGIDKFCDVLHLDKIGIANTKINVCEAIKAAVTGIAEGVKKILEPVIRAIKGLVLDASKLFFRALGTLLNVGGETTFRVRIANSHGGLLQLSDAELGALSLLDTEQQRRRLDDAGLLSNVEKGSVMTLCLGMQLNFFGDRLNVPLEKTCLSIDLEKVKNIFKTIAMEIYTYVKDNIVGKAIEWLKKQWSDWGSKAAKMFTGGLEKVKNFFVDLTKVQAYGRGWGTGLGCCPSGKENHGGLCYPKCRHGYNAAIFAAVFSCWKTCPSNFKEVGPNCLKPAGYGRGIGYLKGVHCSGCSGCSWRGCSGCSNCGPKPCNSGDEQWGTNCFPKCRKGYHGAAAWCAPDCPSGTKDIGLMCVRNSYGLGVGSFQICCPGQEQWGAGCFPKCKPNFKGVGPMCWKTAFTSGLLETTGESNDDGKIDMSALLETEQFRHYLGA